MNLIFAHFFSHADYGNSLKLVPWENCFLQEKTFCKVSKKLVLGDPKLYPFTWKAMLFSVATLVESNQTRDQMTEFWNKHSMAQSVEEMMLDSKAETLTQDEHPEVMGMLPNIKGKDVLELGAGIG